MAKPNFVRAIDDVLRAGSTATLKPVFSGGADIPSGTIVSSSCSGNALTSTTCNGNAGSADTAARATTYSGGTAGAVPRTTGTLFTPSTSNSFLIVSWSNDGTYRGLAQANRDGDGTTRVTHISGGSHSFTNSGAAVVCSITGGDGTLYWAAIRIG